MFRAAVAVAVALATVISPTVTQADVYFGSLHGHTQYSDGQGTPAQAFAWGRQYFDFFAVTDHGEMLTSAEWKEIGRQADRANRNGRFVALRGFEYSNPLQGHACVWDTSSYTSAFLQPTLDGFYRWLDRAGGLASFNHPGDPAGAFRFFALSSNVVDNMVAIETGNGSDPNLAQSPSTQFWSWYLYALDQGWKVAPVFEQDNHSLGLPTPGRTAVHADALSREALLAALRARRVYSTDDPDLRVDFSAKLAGDAVGVPMGSTLPAGDVIFDVQVADRDEPILRLELVTSGGALVDAIDLTDGSNTASWAPTATVTPGQWVVLRVVTQELHGDWGGQDNVAFTAPIWFQ